MLCSSRGRMLDPAVPLYLCLCCKYVVCVMYCLLLGCASTLLAVKILYWFSEYGPRGSKRRSSLVLWLICQCIKRFFDVVLFGSWHTTSIISHYHVPYNTPQASSPPHYFLESVTSTFLYDYLLRDTCSKYCTAVRLREAFDGIERTYDNLFSLACQCD